MSKNIVILQNTEIGSHLALSVFLTNFLKSLKNDTSNNYTLICGEVIKNPDTDKIASSLKIFATHTGLYKIQDNISFSLRALSFLKERSKIQSIDIIHAFYPNSSLLAAVMFKCLYSWKTKILYDVRSPWIEMSFANNHLRKKKSIIKLIMHASELLLTRFVDYFVFITEGTRNYYQKKYHLKNIKSSIIPSGVDVEKFHITLTPKEIGDLKKQYSIHPDAIVIGYVGTIAQMRALDTFFRENIPYIQNTNIQFVFVGDGDGLESLKNVMNTYTRSHPTLFLGKKSPDEIPKILQTFDYGLCHLPDIFVFENSFPLKVLEYLAAGKKVLCSNIGAHRVIQTSFPNDIIIYDDLQVINEIKKESSQFQENILKYSWNYLVSEYKKFPYNVGDS